MEALLQAPDENERIDLLYTQIRDGPNFLQAFDQTQFIDTPLHLAAGEGLTQLALEIQRLMPSFGKKLNADGFSPVHLALQRGHHETAKAMIRLNPELVSVQGREGITPLHYAAQSDAVDILADFLIMCPESIKAFFNVPEHARIDLLYAIIKQDPDFLQTINQKQFIDTPLHLAAGEGMTQLALEIQRLMPSFGMKLNADGFSPVHVALQRGHNETVKAMVRLNPELVSVQGKEGITPLHYAAQIDAVDILADFLLMCPESIEILTVREETAVHVALKSQKLASVKLLVRWLRRTRKRSVLGWQDFEGNNALHLAASTDQPQVIMRLLRFRVGLNAKNDQGLTVLDLVMRRGDNENVVSMLPRRAKTGASITPTPLAKYLSSIISLSEMIGRYLETGGISNEMRSAALVVSALIVNATYQAVLNSGFVRSTQTPTILNITSYSANTTSPTVPLHVLETHQAHNVSKTKLKDIEFAYAIGFMLPNCIALAASLGTMFLLLPYRASNILLHLSLYVLVMSTCTMLATTALGQPNLEVGSNVGVISFVIVFMPLAIIKFGSLRYKRSMKERLMVRGRRHYKNFFNT